MNISTAVLNLLHADSWTGRHEWNAAKRRDWMRVQGLHHYHVESVKFYLKKLNFKKRKIATLYA
jgi:hypothetical protein